MFFSLTTFLLPNKLFGIVILQHFMDEADVLGDRIAVVKQGRLRALGTSKFLKKRFGMGYLLRMSLTSGLPAQAVEQVGTGILFFALFLLQYLTMVF